MPDRGSRGGAGGQGVSARLDALPHRRLENGLAVAVANGWRARFLGLAWLDPVGPDRGLALEPCRSIHTFGMRYALDLIWLDAEGRVLRVDRAVAPRRTRSCHR